jgi:hypothetical protein
VTLRARWVTLRARWVTLRARWVTLRARWVMLLSLWVTLRARWVTLRGSLGDAKSWVRPSQPTHHSSHATSSSPGTRAPSTSAPPRPSARRRTGCRGCSEATVGRSRWSPMHTTRAPRWFTRSRATLPGACWWGPRLLNFKDPYEIPVEFQGPC